MQPRGLVANVEPGRGEVFELLSDVSGDPLSSDAGIHIDRVSKSYATARRAREGSARCLLRRPTRQLCLNRWTVRVREEHLAPDRRRAHQTHKWICLDRRRTRHWPLHECRLRLSGFCVTGLARRAEQHPDSGALSEDGPGAERGASQGTVGPRRPFRVRASSALRAFRWHEAKSRDLQGAPPSAERPSDG